MSDPLLIFNGRINNPVIQEDVDRGTSTVSVQASSLFVDFDRINALGLQTMNLNKVSLQVTQDLDLVR